MARLPGSPDEVRALAPGVLETWEEIRDNVLRSGLVDRELKKLCFGYVEEGFDLQPFEGRERAALEWTQAIAWDADLAGDELWERLHSQFTEPELVELGCAVGFLLGQNHWARTLGLDPHAATS